MRVRTLVLMIVAAGWMLAAGPLRVSKDNPRYFADADGNIVYLTGSHTWNNIVDMGPSDPPPEFDFEKCLQWTADHDHNFIRLWTWELVQWNTVGNNPRHRREPQAHHVSPQPFQRTGPGKALDGKPKFDLTRYDERYFRRLRDRVEAAGKRGIYVSVMLFEGWGVQRVPDAWKWHPMNAANNINGIEGGGLDVHKLANPEVTRAQEAYVRKLIDTVNEFDNVLFEISNENHPGSSEWQYHMIRFIHECERSKPKQHPVGMTFQFRGGSNQTLFDSPAEWISPNNEGGYRDDPPAADGSKVILSDTDHLWGIGGNRAWVWKSFLRGMNPIFMDPYDGLILGEEFDPRWEPIRVAMGQTLQYAKRMNLAKATPHNDLASSGYCLADPGREYLVYLPGGGEVSVNLSAAGGELTVEWFNTVTGKSQPGGKVRGSGRRLFSAPFGGPAVLYLVAK